MITNKTMSLQAALQANEYTLPYHWIGMDNNCLARYLALSAEIVRLIKQYAAPGTGLDIGCGDGRSTFEVSQGLGRDYRFIGLDFDARAIHFAKIFAPEVEFRTADAAGVLPMEDETVSFVCAREVLEHIPCKEAPGFVAEQQRVLKPGGIAVITVPSVNLKVPPKHYRHFNTEILCGLYAGFEVLELHGFGESAKGPLASSIYQVINRCPGLWKIYRERWRLTIPERGDILVGCFRKKNSSS